MVTDQEVEAAARAIVETWAAEKMPGLTWAEAVQAEKEPDEFPALCTLAPLARQEARAALLAAEAARKPDDGPLLPPDWLQREVEKVQDEPPVESWFRLAKPLPMPPYEYQMQHVGTAKAYSGQDPSPSPEHPVDDDALVRRLDGLPQP
jgi:hypothetical protein